MDPGQLSAAPEPGAEIVLGKAGRIVVLLWVGVAAEFAFALANLVGTLTYPMWDEMDALPEGSGEIVLLAVSSLAGLTYAILFIVTAVFFCVWIAQANRNARALGARGMTFTPGWCIGWWFIPVANLFMPYRAVVEVYRASDPRGTAEDWSRLPVPLTLALWWGTWIVSGLLGNASSLVNLSGNPDVHVASAWWTVAAVLLVLPACLALVRIIREIEAMQRAKAGATGCAPAG